MTRRWAVWWLFALAACGPIRSTSYLVDAEVQIEAARTAGAERLAPYELTSAQLYYEKAKDKEGYSEYEIAVDYAQKASQFANQARERAVKQGAVDRQ
jgi:hypothetical protein